MCTLLVAKRAQLTVVTHGLTWQKLHLGRWFYNHPWMGKKIWQVTLSSKVSTKKRQVLHLLIFCVCKQSIFPHLNLECGQALFYHVHGKQRARIFGCIANDDHTLYQGICALMLLMQLEICPHFTNSAWKQHPLCKRPGLPHIVTSGLNFLQFLQISSKIQLLSGLLVFFP